MSKPFRIGQKVVCIDDSHTSPAHYWAGDAPKKGAVYTVTGYDISPITTGIGVLLREIKNHQRNAYTYNPARFRPAVDRKTDIGVFKALLNSVPTTKRKQKETV